MAPLAKLLAMDLYDSDQDLQEAAAQTNALISNNSWNYGDNAYDLAAASYDAAVRDALPGTTGSQPVLFVFSAGNAGGGTNDGTGGNPDTILSPATAKNVITVGAIEQLRYITNLVTDRRQQSNRRLATADGHQFSGGRFFQPRQRRHRHGRHLRAVQAGCGRAGNLCRFHPLRPMGPIRVLQPDEL